MKHPRLLLAAAGLAACLPLAATDLPPVPRFSPAYMDTTVDPRADFARYAWGNWSKDNPIPADKSRWAAFGELDQYNQAGLKAILEAAAAKSHEPGSVADTGRATPTQLLNDTGSAQAPANGRGPRPAAGAPADLADRLILALVNECVACLREGVVEDADLVDAGVIFGAGFAPFRGGPLHWARRRGVAEVVARLQDLAARHGPRFAPDPGWDRLA